MHGPDSGLITAWLKGLEHGFVDISLAQKAISGELPPTPFKGGFQKALKSDAIKIGSMHYVAYWQGLRGEDLYIDTESEPQMTCSRTGVCCTYTMDMAKLLNADTSEAGHD